MPVRVSRRFGPPLTQPTRLVGSFAGYFTLRRLAFFRDQLWAAGWRHGPGGGILHQTPWRAASLSSMGPIERPFWSVRGSRLVSVPVVPGLIQGWWRYSD